MKFDCNHVLVWLWRLEDPHFIDLFLKSINELAEFDYVNVSRHSWTAKVRGVYLSQTLLCV
jgi:hypothetical protein